MAKPFFKGLKHRRRPQQADDFRRGHEGERGGEDGVAGTDAVSHRGHEQGIRAGGATHGVPDAGISRQSVEEGSSCREVIWMALVMGYLYKNGRTLHPFMTTS